jgi:dihydrolipoamide dehydrogenase
VTGSESDAQARCMGERTGFCKVIVDADSDVILGVHILGAHASDLIGEAALAVRNKMTAGQVAETIHPHPTLTEVLRKACVNVRGR